MSSYQEKIEARKERYEELAEKARAESASLAQQSSAMASVIPFGQPILVGHHSEKSDRNYRDRIHAKMDKAVELQDKAEYYERKAASVGKSGISSDDPEAVTKLKDKLEACEKLQAAMTSANKLVRKNDKDGLKALGYSDDQVTKLFQPDFCGRIGFPDYALKNNNAEIRRLKKRIEELSQKSEEPEVTREYAGFEYSEEDNRVQFIFPGKPSEEIRTLLKSYSFKWSPTRGAWVRMLNGNGKYAAQSVIEKLEKINKGAN